jgi:hypothetical protein
MKKRSLVLMFTLALAVLPALPFNARAQKGRMTIDSAGSGSGAGLSSGLIGITAGQTARLSVWNAGDKDVALRLLFIDGDSKILILCTSIVHPGQSFSDDFQWPCCARVELHGEIRVDNKQELDSLTPSLQVIDDQTGKTVVAFGANDFVRFGPIFHPPGD